MRAGGTWESGGSGRWDSEPRAKAPCLVAATRTTLRVSSPQEGRVRGEEAEIKKGPSGLVVTRAMYFLVSFHQENPLQLHGEKKVPSNCMEMW